MPASIFIVVNEDRFFLSHRVPIAIAARNEGYNVTIVAKDTGKKTLIEQLGFRFIDLPINPTGMNPMQEMKLFYFLKRLYSSERPDIVHHVGMKNILWGGVAAKLVGIQGVVNAVSGLGGLFDNKSSTLISMMILKIIRFSSHRSNVKVIFQNNEDRSLFVSNRIVMPNQIELTKGSGIDLQEFSYVPEPNSEKINIIFTSRMIREKGVYELIQAAEILRPLYADRVQFILCGRLTPNKTGITESYMLEHCDGRYITWLGERKDVKKLLEQSHIMAFPSYYREGLPKSLIEASAIGRPIITCDSVGCRDVVTDGFNGFLIQPKDPKSLAQKLEVLILNQSLRKQMGLNSRKVAERDFSIDMVIETHLKVYNELMN